MQMYSQMEGRIDTLTEAAVQKRKRLRASILLLKKLTANVFEFVVIAVDSLE